MNTTTEKPVHSLVLDSGPIIKNEPAVSTLISQAEILYTIPAVIDEIRDAVTRAQVENTLRPFLTLRMPRPASIKVISDFARRTGDLEVLSRPDIQLLALTYELECERNHGDWRLRSSPGQKTLNGVPPASLGDDRSRDEEKQAELVETSKGEPTPVPETRGAWGTVEPRDDIAQSNTDSLSGAEDTLRNTTILTEATQKPSDEQTEVSAEQPTEQPMAAATSIEEVQTVSEVPSEGTQAATGGNMENPTPPDSSIEEEIESDEDSDIEGWITPSNLKKYQAKDADTSIGARGKELETIQVALITTDFAMQNVLLRMNLNLLSSSLQRVKQLKTWVLRCHACFYITKDMSKQFCTRCGKPTLMRTSCSTNKDGSFKVYLKKNMQWNTRGNVYSIPKPVAGSSNTKRIMGGGQGGWGQELILAEDQKEYVNAMTTARRKKEKNLMDEDYLPSILSGDRERTGGRMKIGAGKNVNSRKRK